MQLDREFFVIWEFIELLIETQKARQWIFQDPSKGYFPEIPKPIFLDEVA